MAKSGKGQANRRWKDREAKGVQLALKVLSGTIQVAPLQDGRISVQMGPPGGMGISFFIDQKLILDAAEAGIKFMEANKPILLPVGVKDIRPGATNYVGHETASQPVGGE